jgi:hypothetical protein
MQVVIDIPETYYEYCKKLEDAIEIQLAVKNGTPLPKRHGRLIDADAINLKDISPVDGFSVYGATAEDIDLTPTIIEADLKGNLK